MTLAKLQSEVEFKKLREKITRCIEKGRGIGVIRYKEANEIMKLVDKELATQRTSIIEELRSVLPKKNHITKLSGNSRFDQQVSNEIDGFNEAIDLITEALNKLKEKPHEQ